MQEQVETVIIGMREQVETVIGKQEQVEAVVGMREKVETVIGMREKVQAVIDKIKLDLRAKGYDVITMKLLSINDGRATIRYDFPNSAGG